MNKRVKDYFGTSHLTILICYTIFAIILIAEALYLSWEKWALMLIGAAVVLTWIIHIGQTLNEVARKWIYSIIMMATMFFYGTHRTSTFDVGLLMAVIILLLISTGMTRIITLCQITYYLIMTYDLIQMLIAGEKFDGLVITRIMLHIVVITAVCNVARGIIKRWISIMDKSEEEKEALADTTQKLNDFLTIISHEIRTPINAIIGLTGVSIEMEENDEIKKNLKSVSEAGKRVGSQISDILDNSEIDMNTIAVNNEDYMISSLLQDIVTAIPRDRLADKELVIDVAPTIPAVMRSDVSMIKKIFKHLIDNGLKYTKEGGVYVKLTSEKRDYGINLLIEVTDTGVGMSEEEIENIFEGFYKANFGRIKSSNGLGLGLSIVHGFAKKLNGFVTVESEVGKGTTVRVSLPQQVVDPQGCMIPENPDRLSLGAYFHFEKYPNPHVREFYNSMVRNLAQGLKLQLQRTISPDLRDFQETQSLHIFLSAKRNIWRIRHISTGCQRRHWLKWYVTVLLRDPKDQISDC